MKSRHPVVRPLPPASELQNNFIRGFVSAGLLAGLQNSGNIACDRRRGKRALRLALQGGAALATGAAAADALQRGSPGVALAALAVGATGIVLIERVLTDSISTTKEQHNG